MRDALLMSWEQLSLADKKYIIEHFGSFGNWMNACLQKFIMENQSET